jgi:hypothetical protein
VTMEITVFWDVTPCSLVEFTCISKECVSIFKVEECISLSTFRRNLLPPWSELKSSKGVLFRKAVILIFMPQEPNSRLYLFHFLPLITHSASFPVATGSYTQHEAEHRLPITAEIKSVHWIGPRQKGY